MNLLADRTTSPVRQRYEQVAEHLAQEILRGTLAPGGRLPSERELAVRYGVGRASVREALAALQLHGVLETRRGAGSFVSVDAPVRLRDAGATDVLHHDGAAADMSPSALLDARLTIEPAVARLAAGTARPDADAERLLAQMADAAERGPSATAAWNDADRRFHRQIAAMTDNPVLIATADYVAALMDQPLWRRVRDESIAEPGRMHLHLAEHRMIYEAVTAGEADAAELYARHHIQRVRRYMTLD